MWGAQAATSDASFSGRAIDTVSLAAPAPPRRGQGRDSDSFSGWAVVALPCWVGLGMWEGKDEGARVTGCERGARLFTFPLGPHFLIVAKLHDNKVFVSSKCPSSFLSPAGAWPGVAGRELNGGRGPKEGKRRCTHWVQTLGRVLGHGSERGRRGPWPRGATA